MQGGGQAGAAVAAGRIHLLLSEEDRATQVGPRPVGVAQVCAQQIGPVEGCASQIGGDQQGAAQAVTVEGTAPGLVDTDISGP
ncbi:hypothetical protein GCM10009599_14630 [Luteococcus peritonei]